MIDEGSEGQYGLDMQVSLPPMAARDRAVGNLAAQPGHLDFLRSLINRLRGENRASCNI
jgi:hypothetical protein